MKTYKNIEPNPKSCPESCRRVTKHPALRNDAGRLNVGALPALKVLYGRVRFWV